MKIGKLIGIDKRNGEVQEAEVEKVEDFKYSGSTVQSNREWGKR